MTAQQVRSVLPNSTKTEIVCTANLRQWRHILKLRTSKGADPEIKEIMIQIAFSDHNATKLHINKMRIQGTFTLEI